MDSALPDIIGDVGSICDSPQGFWVFGDRLRSFEIRSVDDLASCGGVPLGQERAPEGACRVGDCTGWYYYEHLETGTVLWGVLRPAFFQMRTGHGRWSCPTVRRSAYD